MKLKVSLLLLIIFISITILFIIVIIPLRFAITLYFFFFLLLILLSLLLATICTVKKIPAEKLKVDGDVALLCVMSSAEGEKKVQIKIGDVAIYTQLPGIFYI